MIYSIIHYPHILYNHFGGESVNSFFSYQNFVILKYLCSLAFQVPTKSDSLSGLIGLMATFQGSKLRKVWFNRLAALIYESEDTQMFLLEMLGLRKGHLDFHA